MKIELGEFFFEELQLCDPGVDKQIKSGISAPGSQALLSRISEGLGFGGAESAATAAQRGPLLCRLTYQRRALGKL